MQLDRREITEVRLRNILREAGLAEPNAVEYAPGEITMFWDERKVAVVIDEIPPGCVEIEDLEGSVQLADGEAGELSEFLDSAPASAERGLTRAFMPNYGRFEAEPSSFERGVELPAPPCLGPDDDIPF